MADSSVKIQKGYKTYIMEPYEIINWDSRKGNGELPNLITGKYCSIARNCTFIFSHHLTNRVSTFKSPQSLFSHNNGSSSSFSRGDIIIGNDVWIGANCTLIDNITLGDGCVIAAGAVVTKSVPHYSIVGGNQAKVIKYRFSEDVIHDLLNLRIWDLPDSDIDALDLWTDDIQGFISMMKNKA
jgi:hypothetical protein